MRIVFMFEFILLALMGLHLEASRSVVDTAYYDLLEVTITATQQEIRQAYKKLAVKLHPDKNPDPSVHDQFLKLTQAYETLKDPDKRLQYDLHGSHPTYGRRYDSRSQSEYNNLFYNGLYSGDLFVENLSGKNYFDHLTEGFHFINFYSPFCPPCQKLCDDWKRLAETFKNLVKIAAVNCKYYNNFCYNVMHITSYPTLLFYQNGKTQRYTVFRGDRSYESLENFLMAYVENEVSTKFNEIMSSKIQPTVYLIGDSWLNKHTINRIAMHLKGLAQIVKITDDGLRNRITEDEYNTVVVDKGGQHHYISSTKETEILNDIAKLLAVLSPITAQQIWEIRTSLRSNSGQKPWVFYLKNDEKADGLLAQKLKSRFTDVEFGEIDCVELSQLCHSLQVDEPPAWAMMKTGGAYERFYGKSNFQELVRFIETAKRTENIQTLSVSEFNRIVNEDTSVWIVAVIPYKTSWDYLFDRFIQASHKYKNNRFGVMMCQPNSAKFCNPVALNNPVIIVQNKTQQFKFRGQQSTDSLIDFIETVMDNSGRELTENEFNEIMKQRGKVHSWAIAFFPEFCDENCQQIKYEWKIVSKKMVPVNFVKIAFVDCGSLANKKLCSQSVIRSPILRVYPASSPNNYVAQLLSLNRAAYILEWLLGIVDDSVMQMSRPNFVNNVLAPPPDAILTQESNVPWLVYFHSPRCYRCYEMYTDFFIVGMMLKGKVKLGKINCLQEREICSHEAISSYPSIKLYVKNQHRTKSYHFVPQQYEILLKDIKQHLNIDDVLMAQNLGKIPFDQNNNFKHDEF